MGLRYLCEEKETLPCLEGLPLFPGLTKHSAGSLRGELCIGQLLQITPINSSSGII